VCRICVFLYVCVWSNQETEVVISYVLQSLELIHNVVWFIMIFLYKFV